MEMMKRGLLAATAMAFVLIAATLPAEEPKLKTVKPDWHYRWHEGRWWYWMPQTSSWMVWNDASWIPYEKFAAAETRTAGQLKVVANEQPAADNGAAQQAGIGESCPVTTSGYSSSPSYSQGNGSGYLGYGWSWGSGTAFRNGPGARF
jgi:hypothetical protein